MISCDDCQKKMVAVLDNESSAEDVKLVFGHLADCTACRTFYNELISTRQLFSISTAMKEPVIIGHEFMRTVEAETQRSRKFSGEKTVRTRTLSRNKLSRVMWAGGAAAALLIVASWLACYSLAREVADVRGRLHAANQDLAVVRAEKQIEEDRQKEQKVITALYLRMAELESRVDRYSSPRTTFLPAEQNRRSDRPGDM
jgi:anti-sigma factor RsiW